MRIGALCNDAKIERTERASTVLGDPTEAALIVAAEKAGLEHAALARDHPRRQELPFDSVKQRMITVHERQAGGGLREGRAGRAPRREQQPAERGRGLGPDGRDRQRFLDGNEELAGAGLRVLALAYKELPVPTEEDLERDLTFVGLVGMEDPLRDEARAAIATCREAGIRTVMITGDQLVTAGRSLDSWGSTRMPRVPPAGRARTGPERSRRDQWQRVVSTHRRVRPRLAEAEAADRRSPPGTTRRSWP